MKTLIILSILLATVSLGFAQSEVKYKVHSHNDYLKPIPFWDAYSAGASSIEVDLFLKDNTLFATHHESEILQGHTLKNLYLEPLQKAYGLGLGENQELILLIDIKSEAYETMDAIVNAIEAFPGLVENEKITFVISGNRPKVADYPNYPDFIYFDYQSLDNDLTPEQKDKIALVSLNFQNFVRWNGQKEMTSEEFSKTEAVVKQAHSLNKEFRFWAIPDTEISWKVFSEMGVDYINTDNVYECVSFLNAGQSGK